MAKQPVLLTSGGTAVQISVLPFGAILPVTTTITVSAAAVVGATSLSVTMSGDTTRKLYSGLKVIFGVGGATEQWVEIATDALGTATTLQVEPLKKAIASGATAITFAAIPLIGLEAANLNLSTETNQAVLLSNDGWRVTDYSTGSFEISGTLYTPTNRELSVGSDAVADALIDKKNLYIERILPNGTYHAGLAVVSSNSDTTTGAQYVSQNVTFTGSGKLFQRRLNPLA